MKYEKDRLYRVLEGYVDACILSEYQQQKDILDVEYSNAPEMTASDKLAHREENKDAFRYERPKDKDYYKAKLDRLEKRVLANLFFDSFCDEFRVSKLEFVSSLINICKSRSDISLVSRPDNSNYNGGDSVPSEQEFSEFSDGLHKEGAYTLLAEKEKKKGKIYSSCPKDILLDKNIVLQITGERDKTSYDLLFIQEGGGFKEKEHITPSIAQAILHLHQLVGKPVASKSLSDLKNVAGKSISNRRKGLSELCEKHQVKQILITNAESKWQLNPDLDCWNGTR